MTTRRDFLGALAAVAVVRPGAPSVPAARGLAGITDGGTVAWDLAGPPPRERFMLERRLLERSVRRRLHEMHMAGEATPDRVIVGSRVMRIRRIEGPLW